MDIKLINSRQLNRMLGSDLFKGMKKEDLLRILEDDRVTISSYKRGEDIYDQKIFSRSLAYILDGTATVYMPNGSDQDLPMRRISKNGFFGVAALFNDEPEYVSKIVAGTDVSIVFFSQDIVEEIIRTDPGFSMNMIRFLSDRVRFLNGRISLLSNSSSTDSVADYLVSRALKMGNEFDLEVSYTTLAKALNISRSSLYRSFEELEKNGLISREGKTITVNDLTALEKYIL